MTKKCKCTNNVVTDSRAGPFGIRRRRRCIQCGRRWSTMEIEIEANKKAGSPGTDPLAAFKGNIRKGLVKDIIKYLKKRGAAYVD